MSGEMSGGDVWGEMSRGRCPGRDVRCEMSRGDVQGEMSRGRCPGRDVQGRCLGEMSGGDAPGGDVRRGEMSGHHPTLHVHSARLAKCVMIQYNFQIHSLYKTDRFFLI